MTNTVRQGSQRKVPMSGDEVSIEIEGRTYTGRYVVSGQGSGRTVTVSTPLYGSKTTQVGGSPPETIARMLLRELIQAGMGRKDMI